MYLIEISNQNGSFAIGTYKKMGLTEIKGIGAPSKSTKTMEFINFFRAGSHFCDSDSNTYFRFNFFKKVYKKRIKSKI